MSQFLEQSEVDALLRGLDEKEKDDEDERGTTDQEVAAYDLTSPERFIGGRMPLLESVNQKMAQQLRTAFASALRQVVDVRALPVETIKYSEFLKTLPAPTSMHVFRMLPLWGESILTIQPKLAFALIDRFLGGLGSANVKVEGRDFTPIESRMILRVVEYVFEEMQRAWEPIEMITIELGRSEINPQFVGLAAPNDVVFIIRFEVEMDEAQGIITFCIPYSTLEPIRSKLYVNFQGERRDIDATWMRRLLWHMESVEIEASVEMGSTEISMETLLYLQVGDIIRLDQDCDSDLLVKVAGVPKFKGRPCRIRQRTALQVTSRIEPPEVEAEGKTAYE